MKELPKFFSEEAQNFVPVTQLLVVKEIVSDEEGQQEMEDVFDRINAIVAEMPKTYETEDVPYKDKKIWLRYFAPNAEWLILEKDMGDPEDVGMHKGLQHQAFGIANIGGAADSMGGGLGEMGYISIQELRQIPRVELDFYFRPITVGALIEKRSGKKEQDSKASPLTTVPIAKRTSDFKLATEKYYDEGFHSLHLFETELIFALVKNGFTVKHPEGQPRYHLLAEKNGVKVHISDEKSFIELQSDPEIKQIYKYTTTKPNFENIDLTDDGLIFLIVSAARELVEHKKNGHPLKQNPEPAMNKTEDLVAKEVPQPDTSATTSEKNVDLTKMVNDDVKHIRYVPVSDACGWSLNTVVPKGMAQEMYNALYAVRQQLKTAYGWDLDDYVQDRLKFTPEELGIDRELYDRLDETGQKNAINAKLCEALAPEQIDAVALAIYNIEVRKQGMIVGDMTGIGKGRIAAAIMRYCIVYQQKVPVFLTEKSYLFSDIYRDLIDVKSDPAIPAEFKTGEREREVKMNKAQIAAAVKDLMENNGYTREEALEEVEQKISVGKEMVPTFRVNENYKKQIRQAKNRLRIVPFILNNDDSRTRVQDGDGNILYYAQKNATQEFKTTLEKQRIPEGYNLVMATYSQLSSSDKSKKKAFFETITKDTIVLCDESHNASGTSNTGNFIRELLQESMGAVFLSATYAKRPDNMAIYAAKTSMIETGLSSEQITAAILDGGVALQEIISSQLVAEGQMVRRERTFEGVNILWNIMGPSMSEQGHPEFDLSDRHRAIADSFTNILRDIIDLQQNYIRKWTRDPKVAREFLDEYYGEVEIPRGYDVKKTLGQSTVFSRVFNVMSQLLFSIKCEAIANRAIEYLKQGKKPVIAFSNTMESFLDQITTDEGRYLTDGDIINADFKIVLTRLLDNLRYLNVKSPDGTVTKIALPEDKVPLEVQQMFRLIEQKINRISIGISISPIDVIIKKISDAGFSVDEITGRESRLVYLDDTFLTARYERKKKSVATNLFRAFNQNQLDCVLINQSGSTGGSIHAKPNDVANKVKVRTGINQYDSLPYKKELDGDIVVPDSLEPRDEVKQRVMIILQPELNINTEVQKRGRIFRSGQVLMPMYEYLCSSIPAEMRFQMMLQKKLRSLDANTSSNQKQSDNILNIVDFLNPIGDKIVVNYLMENKALILRLGDPLKMYTEENNSYKYPDDITDAAHKITGRVAVLNISEQEKFYTEISQRYTDRVAMLKATGEYDMEVEYYDLQAKTLDRKIFAVGTGKGSLFGRNAILELCEVNNLRKPYNKAELDTIMAEALQDFQESREPGKAKQKYLLQEHSRWQQNRLAHIADENTRKKEDSLSRLLKDEKYIKLQKNNPDEAEKWMKTMRENVSKRYAEDLQNEREYLETRYQLVRNYLQRIYPGLVFDYISNEKAAAVKAVVIDVVIDLEMANPFTPSAVSVKVAVANGIRMIYIPLSQTEEINSLLAHVEVSEYEARNTIAHWDRIIAEAVSDRINQYIITGNILLGMGNMNDIWGKLIKFTTANKKIRTGILLPGFDPSKGQQRGAQFVQIPLDKCMPILRDMSTKARYMTGNNLEFSKEDGTVHTAYVMRVPKNNRKYKDILTDATILGYLNEAKGFTDSSSNDLMNIWDEENNRMTASMGMEATIEADRMPGLLKYLTDAYGAQLRVALDVLEAKKEALGLDLTLDYEDGLGIEESESGLAQVEITVANPEMQQVVQQQADPVAEAAEQTEQTVVGVIEQTQPSPELIEKEANLLLQQQHFALQKKMFKLYQLILLGGKKMGKGGKFKNGEATPWGVVEVLFTKPVNLVAVAVESDACKKSALRITEKSAIDNIIELWTGRVQGVIIGDKLFVYSIRVPISRIAQIVEEVIKITPSELYDDALAITDKGVVISKQVLDIHSDTEEFAAGGHLNKYSKAWYLQEIEFFTKALTAANITFEVFDSFKTDPSNIEGIRVVVYTHGLTAEKIQALKDMAKLHDLHLAKEEPTRITFSPGLTKAVRGFATGGVIDNYRNELDTMSIEAFAKEVGNTLGFDEQETISELNENGDDRESLISEILWRYKKGLQSRGEKFEAGGGIKIKGITATGSEIEKAVRLKSAIVAAKMNLKDAVKYEKTVFRNKEEMKEVIPYAQKKVAEAEQELQKALHAWESEYGQKYTLTNGGNLDSDMIEMPADLQKLYRQLYEKQEQLKEIINKPENIKRPRHLVDKKLWNEIQEIQAEINRLEGHYATGGSVATGPIDTGKIYTANDAREHKQNWRKDFSHTDPEKIYQTNHSPRVSQFYIKGKPVNKIFVGNNSGSINDLGRLLWDIMFMDEPQAIEYAKDKAINQFILNTDNYYYTRLYRNPYKYWHTEGASEQQVDNLIAAIYSIENPHDITYRIADSSHQQYPNTYEEGGSMRSSVATGTIDSGKIYTATDAREHKQNWRKDFSHTDPEKIYQTNRSPRVSQFYIKGKPVNKIFTGNNSGSINDLGHLLWDIMFMDEPQAIEYAKDKAVNQFILNNDNYYYTRNYLNAYKYWDTEGASEQQVDNLIAAIYSIESPYDITYRIADSSNQQYTNTYEEGGSMRNEDLLAKGGSTDFFETDYFFAPKKKEYNKGEKVAYADKHGAYVLTGNVIDKNVQAKSTLYTVKDTEDGTIATYTADELRSAEQFARGGKVAPIDLFYQPNKKDKELLLIVALEFSSVLDEFFEKATGHSFKPDTGIVDFTMHFSGGTDIKLVANAYDGYLSAIKFTDENKSHIAHYSSSDAHDIKTPGGLMAAVEEICENIKAGKSWFDYSFVSKLDAEAENKLTGEREGKRRVGLDETE